MHNIKTNFGRFYRICKEFFESETDSSGNFQFYPRRPELSDIQVVALSCTMEALGIDSENLLWSKLKTDYASLFPHLICRTRFNRRRRRLQPHIEAVQSRVAERLDGESEALVVDSIPVPVVKLAREKTYKVFKAYPTRHPLKAIAPLAAAGLSAISYTSLSMITAWCSKAA